MLGVQTDADVASLHGDSTCFGVRQTVDLLKLGANYELDWPVLMAARLVPKSPFRPPPHALGHFHDAE
jgi:hypothetical protein